VRQRGASICHRVDSGLGWGPVIEICPRLLGRNHRNRRPMSQPNVPQADISDLAPCRHRHYYALDIQPVRPQIGVGSRWGFALQKKIVSSPAIVCEGAAACWYLPIHQDKTRMVRRF